MTFCDTVFLTVMMSYTAFTDTLTCVFIYTVHVHVLQVKVTLYKCMSEIIFGYFHTRVTKQISSLIVPSGFGCYR